MILGSGFDPGEELPLREHHTAAEFPVRDAFVMYHCSELRTCDTGPMF